MHLGMRFNHLSGAESMRMSMERHGRELNCLTHRKRAELDDIGLFPCLMGACMGVPEVQLVCSCSLSCGR